MTPVTRPLLERFPEIAPHVHFAPLGQFPTPVERLTAIETRVGCRAPLYAKRDDLSSPVYGGNKVRTLEVLFGEALAKQHTRIYSTGAYGTNHGLATILHAPRVGLEPGVILFPQPVSYAALENLRVMLSARPLVRDLPHFSALPFGMLTTARREAKGGHRTTIMVPGGATPVGGIGYVNAGLELATQIANGEMPVPALLVVGVGSTCTTAGLLVGLHLAASLGIGFTRPPDVVAVRVTPWPVTSRYRIVGLAVQIAALLASMTGDRRHAFDAHTLGATLTVTGRHLGFGYGHATREGKRAKALFDDALGWALDTTYSAKAVAGALEIAGRAGGPVLYWSTKSTMPLPAVSNDALQNAPKRMKRWISRAEAGLCARGELPFGYVRLDERDRTT